MDLVRPPERLRRIAGERAPRVDKVVIVLLQAREAVQHGVEAIDGVLNDRESIRVVIMCEIERWLQPGALEEDPISSHNRNNGRISACSAHRDRETGTAPDMTPRPNRRLPGSDSTDPRRNSPDK